MQTLHLQSAAAQVAAHLRMELLRGTWSGLMPGVRALSEELGVNHKTVEAALERLEHEGLLVGLGPRRRRRIEMPGGGTAVRSLRVSILLTERGDRRLDYMIELLHELVAKGHGAAFADKTLAELGMNPARIARFVAGSGADAWVVLAGAREVLEWFGSQEKPAFALFGRRRGLPIAGVGPDKLPAMAEATRTLIRLGHRRIVLLCRARRRLPEPGEAEQVFLDELAAHGLSPDDYNLPDWKETKAGFRERLDALFQVTPPTALIVDEAPFFVAALQFLARRGIRVPQDVSLVCTDDDRTFSWCDPAVARIAWDSGPVVRRIVRWAANVSRGKKDVRQPLTPAEFVPGGTVGPAKPSSR